MEQAGSQPAGALSVALAAAAELLDGDPAQVGARAGEILSAIPGQQQALLLLVCARRMAADKTGARAVLEAMAKAAPGLASVQYELGLLLGALGEPHSAIAALSRTVELEPNHPSAWRALGNQLAQSGDKAAAGRAYARHVSLSLKEFELLENATSQSEQQLGPAENMLREFLKIHGTDPSTTHMLARVGMRLGRYDDAEQLFARALELAPNFNVARQDYASALDYRMKWHELGRQLDILLAQEPHKATNRAMKAASLLMIGEDAAALAGYERLLADHPREARFWNEYGNTLRTIGRLDDAVAAFRRSIELRPSQGNAYRGLSNLKTFYFSDEDVDMMRAQLECHDLSTEDHSQLNFALGKAMEDRQQYSKAFEYYDDGSTLRRMHNSHDPEISRRLVQRSKALFTRDFFRARAGSGLPSPAPIFIVGLPRSGSTLIEQILASHPGIEGTTELSDVTLLAMQLDTTYTEYPEVLRHQDSARLVALGEEYLARAQIHRKLGRPFFVDKMPANFEHLGFIHLMLPNARIIDARRHPLACCFSIFKHDFIRGMNYTFNLSDIGRYYRDYVEMMAHFDAVLPGRIHRVFYEDMVRDPETEIRRLLDYCGVPFDEACLKFHENRRSVRTVSSEQVRRPVYTDALEQWRNFDPWLGPLKTALGSVLGSYPAVPAF